MIVSIPARARMRPAHQLARAQHQLAGRDVGAPDPLLNSAAIERRLRRAVRRGKITGTGHIWGRSVVPSVSGGMGPNACGGVWGVFGCGVAGCHAQPCLAFIVEIKTPREPDYQADRK
jgi:hypothetical protein